MEAVEFRGQQSKRRERPALGEAEARTGTGSMPRPLAEALVSGARRDSTPLRRKQRLARGAACWHLVAALSVVCGVLMRPAHGATTDATRSKSTGVGLQYATAGVLAQFTVTAFEEDGVRRTSGGDDFIVQLAGTRSLLGSVIDNLDGSYQATYIGTKSGAYEVSVKLLREGGLTASYFENVWFFYTPALVAVDPQINHDWGTGLLTATATDYVSVRWEGKVKPFFTETYTFIATSDDGAKLWVDGVPLIDRWDSFCNDTAATISLKSNVFVDIRMEYKEVVGTAIVRLFWESHSAPKELVPSSAFYFETHAAKSPFGLVISPSFANGAASHASGSGLSVATAGTAAVATIQVNDRFDNERGVGGDVLTVRLFPPSSRPADEACMIDGSSPGRAVHAVVVDNTDSSYSVEYTSFISGNSSIFMHHLQVGGVHATYYDAPDFTAPRSARYASQTIGGYPVAQVGWQSMSATAGLPGGSIATADGYSVRWAGFVSPTQDGVYTFQWARSGNVAGDRVKLWVDNSEVISHWSSLEAANPQGTLSMRAFAYYDLWLKFKVEGAGVGEHYADLKWKSGASAMQSVPSSSLFEGYPLHNSPYQALVHPAVTCASRTIATANSPSPGHSLELATAGVQAEFSITAKDLYGNLKSDGNELFLVRFSGTETASGVVQDRQDGTYRVLYTLTKSGTYAASVVFGATGIMGSPFRIAAQPARRNLGYSPAVGEALSLATAGALSVFTVSVRDSFHNWQPDPSVAQASIAIGMLDIKTGYKPPITQEPYQVGDLPAYTDTVGFVGDASLAGTQVATPTSLDNPRLKLRYVVTRTGEYAMTVAASVDSPMDGKVSQSPFSVVVLPNAACGATSSASGHALSLGTAGLPGSLTIFSRDEYANSRLQKPPWNAGVQDQYVVHVRQHHGNSGANAPCWDPASQCNEWNTYNTAVHTVGGRDKPGRVRDRGDGTHVAEYDATRAGINYLWVSLAAQGGLHATYYANSLHFAGNSSTRVSAAPASLDFRFNSSNANRYSVKWTGLLKSSVAGTYTFFLGSDLSSSAKTERIKLWVDNSLIINQWDSLTTTSMSVDGSTVWSPHGTIPLAPNAFYQIMAQIKEYGPGTEGSRIRLQWQMPNASLQVVPSDRLYLQDHVSGSPFVCTVHPGDMCAATSRVYKQGLSLTTAGRAAFFTVQSRDFYDNKRDNNVRAGSGTKLDFALLGNASLPPDNTVVNRVQDSYYDGGTLEYETNVSYMHAGSGGFRVEYLATKEGVYNMRGRQLKAGGIYGTYFENADFTDSPITPNGQLSRQRHYERIDNKIDFMWAGSERPCGEPSDIGKTIGPDYFSVRWRGRILTPYSEVFTFFITADDGAKLKVNDLLIAENGPSTCSIVEGTIAVMQDTVYPIELEYYDLVGNATIRLEWSSRSLPREIMDTRSFYSWSTSYYLSNSNNSLFVEPARMCASTSSAFGPQLSISTAGARSIFTIQSRDEYLNNRKGPDSGLMPKHWSLAQRVADSFIEAVASPSRVTLQGVSTIPDAYKRKRIHLHELGWDAEIVAHTAAREVTVSPPFPYNPPVGSNFTVYDGDALNDFDGEWYQKGLPAFHVRINPISDPNGRTIHVAPIREPSVQYAGGLSATYYTLSPGDREMQRPLWSTPCTYGQPCDETIDFSLANNAASSAQLVKKYGGGVMGSETVRGWEQEYCLPTLEYGVRWSGFVSPSVAGEYSFTVHFYDSEVQVNPDDRVKLWIDNTLVIQQWSSLIGAGMQTGLAGGGSQYEIGLQGTFFFPRAYPEPYPISIHYKNLVHNSRSGLRLSWQSVVAGNGSQVVPSSRLFPMSGRYEVDYTTTIAGDYQVHVSAAQGHGLDATFYSDTDLLTPLRSDERESIDLDASLESFLGGDSSFSVRWAGLLKLKGAEQYDDTAPDVFTFEASVAEPDERVKLWVDNSLIIDRWQTYGDLVETVFSATISLQKAFYHDLKMEYRQDGGNAARANLKWKCGTAAAECRTPTPTSIRSSNLFLIQDVRASPFAPFTVHPAKTCSDTSTASGLVLSLGTAGVKDTFLITSLDEYGNDRDKGTDLYHVRAVPVPIWDVMEPYSEPRLSQDCIACRDTLRGGVLDHGDGLYTAEVEGYKKGNYKVLAELALAGGVFATYYSVDAAEDVGPSAFHRGASGQISGAGGAQLLNTALDLATPCVYRKNWPGVPEGTYQCSKWIKGRAQGGDLSKVLLDRQSWSHGVSLPPWTDWTIFFTKGACKGQHRTLTNYQSAAHGGTATLSSPLSEIPGTIADAFDSAKSHTYLGCFGPDTSSEYVLFSSAGAPGSIAASVFAVRWAGLVRASLASPYTFHTSLSGEAASHERVKLWVDGQLLIDQWTSLQSLSLTALAPRAVSNSSQLEATSPHSEILYHVQVEYKRGRAVAGKAPRMRLEFNNLDIHGYTAPGATPGTKGLEEGNLFTALPIPTSEFLRLEPAPTCAALSEVHGAGLSQATAGVVASFLVTARDAYSNLRQLHEDSWLSVIEPLESADASVRTSVAQTLTPGVSALTYTVTVGGAYSVRVLRAHAGGLLGQYYNNMWMVGDVKMEHVDASIDFDWGSRSVAPDCGESPEEQTRCPMGADYVSVVWSGYFKPELSETYTFWLHSDDGSRLYLQGNKVIDRWCLALGALDACSMESGEGSANASLACSAGQLYEIRLEYKEVTDMASVKLYYSSPSIMRSIVPSSRLYHSAQHVQGSPFDLYVAPNLVNAHTSSAHGHGLSFATAGSPAMFTVIARDDYDNLRTDWKDTMVSYALNMEPTLPRTHGASAYGARGGRVWRGSVAANVVPGSYRVSYAVTTAGTTRISAAVVATGGLHATYYDSADAQTFGHHAVMARSVQQVSEGPEGGTIARGGPLRAHSVTNSGYTVRWAGLLRADFAAIYSFQTLTRNMSSAVGPSERIKLWIDSQLIIDQWTSLSSGDASPIGTYSFPVAHDYYELELLYQSQRMQRLTVELLAAPSEEPLASLPSSKLLRAMEVGGPWHVRAQPSATDLDACDIYGLSLTLSTAGVSSSFVIVARDTFGNLRGVGGDEFVVQASDGRTSIYGEVTDLGTGTYSVQYYPEVSASYQVKVNMGSDMKHFTLFVHPGAPSPALTLLSGGSLSIATAGYAATFTIQSKDAFGNLRCEGTDAYNVELSGPIAPEGTHRSADHRSADHSSAAHLLRARYIGQLPASNLGRHTAAFRVTSSGDYHLHVHHASSPGLNATYFSDSQLQDAAVVRSGETISYDWGSDSPYQEGSTSNEWSARWNGLVQAQYTETYTFQATIAEADERVRLWVHQEYVIDQWSSLKTISPTGTIWLAAGAVAKIELEYSARAGVSAVALKWKSSSQPLATVPSENLFSLPQHVKGSPFTLTVYPANTCGATSIARGQGLSLATAGSVATFSIIARDHLGNVRGASDQDIFVVRARHGSDFNRRDLHATLALSPNAPLPGPSPRPHHPGAPPAQGVYHVSYQPLWKRSPISVRPTSPDEPGPLDNAANRPLHDLTVEFALRGALMATYYSHSAEAASGGVGGAGVEAVWGKPSRSFLRHNILDSEEHAKLRPDEIALRYKGMIEPPFAHRYTFGLELPADDDRVRLWVDNSLIVDQWTSLSALILSGTLAVDAIPALYALQLEYKDGNMTKVKQTGFAGPSLQWSYTDQTFPIASMRLYHAHQLPIKTSSGAGLSATYYSVPDNGDLDAALPVKTSDATTTLDWSGVSSSDRPFAHCVPDAGWRVRWTGFIIPSRTDLYTFYTPVAAGYHTGGGSSNRPPAVDVSERVRLWVDDVLLVDQWTSLSTMEASGTYAFATAAEWYNLRLEYALVNRSQSSLPRGVTLQWENQAGRAPLLGLPAELAANKVAKGRVQSDRLLRPIISNKIIRDDYEIWANDWYSPEAEHLDVRLTQPLSAPSSTNRWDAVAGCPGPQPFSWRHFECRGHGVSDNQPARVRVRAAPMCADTSSVLGVAMSISTAGVTRTFTLTARDAYDNQRDALDDFFIARASLDADLAHGRALTHMTHGVVAAQPWEFLSEPPAGLEPANPPWDVGGKYEVTYRTTLAGRYTTTVHAAPVAPEGHGLVAAFLPPASERALDEIISRVDPSLSLSWGTGAPTHSKRIPSRGFRGRWTGLLMAPHPGASNAGGGHAYGAGPGAAQRISVSFQVRADGPVSLFIGGELVASAGSQGIIAAGPDDHVQVGDQPPSQYEEESLDQVEYGAKGTAELLPGVLYDIRVEYQRSSEPESFGFLNVTWGWEEEGQGGHDVAVTQHPIPSSALLPSRRPVQGGRLPLVVHPNVACASTSQAYGHGLSIATAGIPASFSIIVRDEYANVREDPMDILLPQVVPRQALFPSSLDSTHMPELAYPIHLPTSAAATTPVPPLPVGEPERAYTPYLASLGKHAAWGLRKFGAATSPKVRNEALSPNSFPTAELEEARLFGELRGNLHAFSYVTQAAGTHDVHVDLLHAAVPAGAVIDVQIEHPGTSNLTTSPPLPLMVTCVKPCQGSGLAGECHLQGNDTLAVSHVILTSHGHGYQSWHPPKLSCGAALSGLRLLAVVSTGSYSSAAGQGLHATFYESSSFFRTLSTTARARVSLNDFASVSQSSSSAAASAVWTGFFRLPVALTAAGGSGDTGGGTSATASMKEATIQTHLASNHERVKLWIDHALIIDQWSSLASAVSAALLPPQARGRGGYMVPIRVEYKRGGSASLRDVGLALKWAPSAATSNASLLDLEHLFAASTIGTNPGAPGLYEDRVGGGRSEQLPVRRVTVEPNVACAAASHVSGEALTVATAGVTTSFRILIRDEYGNARAQGGHELVARLWSAECETVHTCQPLGPQVGSSYASSGPVVPGGASLSSGLLHLDQNQTHTSVCNMSLGQVGLPRNAQHEWYAGSDDAAVRAAAAAGAEAGKWVVFKKGLCAGRWVQIRAVNASGRCLELEPAWADGQPPCRPSAAQGAASPTGTTYIIATAPWARPAMPPLDATSQPPQQVRAEVHELDPSAQAAAAAVERATASAEQQGIPAAVEAQEAAAGDAGWHYGVTYLATRKGQYSVVTSLVGAPGLMATYYSLPSKVGADALGAQTPTAASLYAGGPVSAQRWGAQWQHEQYAVDWSGSPDSGSTDGGKGLVPHSSLAAAGATGFGIRWTGFLRSDGPRMYALRVALGGARTGAGGPLSIGAGGERVKLWVDNSLVIDQWDSLATTAPLGTIALSPAQGNLHDISLLYKCANVSNGCGISLQWDHLPSPSTLASPPSGPAASIKTARVPYAQTLERSDVPNHLGHLLVLPAPPCGARSFLRGSALTLATAGVQASFRIFSRDAYENANERSMAAQMRYSVEVQGVAGMPRLNPGVRALVPHLGSSACDFTVTEAKAYRLSVTLQGHALAHSPISLLVKPAAFCAAQSTVQGAGMSKAEVAPRLASFMIQARDSFGNARTSATPSGSGGGFHVRLMRSNLPLHFLPPFPPAANHSFAAAHVVLPTTTAQWKPSHAGDALSRYHGHYMMASEPWDATIAPILHVSWAQRGGLHATYYTSAMPKTGEHHEEALPAPCETTALPRTHVQVAIPIPNVTHPASGSSDMQDAVASCPHAQLADSRLIIRYHGMMGACDMAPASCGGNSYFERSFNWTVHPADRVKLWIDNKLLIDQWTSLDSTSVGATHRFLDRAATPDFAAHFQRLIAKSSSNDAADRQLANQHMSLRDDGTQHNSSSIPTTRLLSVADLSGSPFAVVLP